MTSPPWSAGKGKPKGDGKVTVEIDLSRISDEAWQGFRKFADAQGMTVHDVMEAMLRTIASFDPNDRPQWVTDIFDEAIALQAQWDAEDQAERDAEDCG
jgi:hypothetical protein